MSTELRDTIALALQAAESEALESGAIPGYSMYADAVLAALQAGGWEVVKLPKRPSEYWGPKHEPQWNHYPYTRVDGDVIEIGARCEHVYRPNLAEARIFAADVLAAAKVIESATEDVEQ